MSSASDLLASLGIEVSVGNPSNPTVAPQCLPSIVDGTTYPSGLVSTLSVATAIPWLLLAYTIFKYRGFILMYIQNRIEFAYSNRTDLSFELDYRFMVGSELHSAISMKSASDQAAALDRVSIAFTQTEDEAGEELEEIIIE
jgi:hypothetical protein